MRERVQYIYTAEELREQHPAGFARALDKHRDNVMNEDSAFYTEEIYDSMRNVWAAAGYSEGRYGMDPDVAALTGKRAWAWFEHKLQEPYRIPWQGQLRRYYAQFGRYYRPGMVPPCPFTGVSYDEDMLDDIRDTLRRGGTVGNALGNLRNVADRLADAELEYRCSEEAFLEDAEANNWEYTEDGEFV